MAKSKDTKKNEAHPDFDKLLEQEKSRLSSKKSEETSTASEAGKDDADLNLEDFEHFDWNDEDIFNESTENDTESNEEGSSLSDQNQKEEPSVEKENKHQSSADDAGLDDVISGSEDEMVDHVLDDSMEFNFDENGDHESDSSQVNSNQTPSAAKKKSGSFVTYVIVGVVVLVVAGLGYAFIHHRSEAEAQARQVSQRPTNFKPVLPTVQALPDSTPPSLPQTLTPDNTSSVLGGSETNDQLLSDSHFNDVNKGGLTMLEINRTQLLGLLSNFQKVVDKSNQSVVTQISNLKTSVDSMAQSNQNNASAMDAKLDGMGSQMKFVDQKLDNYNKSISGVQTALEKTQEQLKLILAQRAEDITHYTLRAVVPGRAWLVDGEGKTVTIVLGEELKDYGKVEEINDKIGYVKMSSGFVFK